MRVSLCVTAFVVIVGSVANGRFLMRARALFHSRESFSLSASVGNRRLVMLKVEMDVGGAVGAVSNWAAALKHLPVALLQASSHVLKKDGGVCEISGL